MQSPGLPRSPGQLTCKKGFTYLPSFPLKQSNARSTQLSQTLACAKGLRTDMRPWEEGCSWLCLLKPLSLSLTSQFVSFLSVPSTLDTLTLDTKRTRSLLVAQCATNAHLPCSIHPNWFVEIHKHATIRLTPHPHHQHRFRALHDDGKSSDLQLGVKPPTQHPRRTFGRSGITV